MTLTISLSPQDEARLRDLAAASGKDVETFVREVVAEKLGRGSGAGGSSGPAQTPAAGPADADWFVRFNSMLADMRRWAEANLPPGHFVDDSRGSIYEGRGE